MNINATTKSKKIKRSLGKKSNANKVNTNWIQSSSEQRELESQSFNTQYLPLELIDFDPENARVNYLNRDELINGPKLTDYLNANPSEMEMQKEIFNNAVENFFASHENSHNKIEDYLKLSELAISIKKPEDLIHPISVYPCGTRFKVNSGNCRTMAHFLLDVKKIAAIIRDQKELPFSKAIKQYKENIHRYNYNLHEEILAVNKIQNQFYKQHNKKMTINNLMSEVGLKKTKAGYLISICKAFNEDPLFKEFIISKKLNSIEIAQQIARVKDLAIRRDTLNNLKNTETLKFKEIEDSIKKAKKREYKRPTDKMQNQTSLVRFSNKSDLANFKTLFQYIYDTPLFQEHSNELSTNDLSKESDVTKVLREIFKVLKNKKGTNL